MAKAETWRVVVGTITRRNEKGGPRGRGVRYVKGDTFKAAEHELQGCMDQVEKVESASKKQSRSKPSKASTSYATSASAEDESETETNADALDG